jgi:predicted PurR-regulated permease PerM
MKGHPSPLQLFFIVAGVCLLIWLLSNIILYIVIALIISAFLRPITDYINDFYLFQYKIPRIIAVLCAFSLLIGLLTFFVLLFVPLISEQLRILSSNDFDTLLNRLTSPVTSLENFVINILELKREPGFVTTGLRKNMFSFLENLKLESVINFTIQFSATFFVSVLAVAFISFFLLYEKGLLRRNIIKLIPNQYFELSITALHKIERLLSNYLMGLLLQIFSIFSLTAVGLTIVGINYALTIAVFAAFVNVVPYIGPITGGVFAVLVGLSTTTLAGVENESLALLVRIVLVQSVVHLIDNLVLQPLIFSKSVKAHPLEIFVAIFAGATLAGPLGMIAAIPVYTILRVSALELRTGYKQYHIFKIPKK